MKKFLVALLIFTPFLRMSAAESTQYAKAEVKDFTMEEAGAVGQAVGTLLAMQHYSMKPLNDEVSREFLTNYFNALDYNHLFFQQGDFDEFHRRYADELDDSVKRGDITPAIEIYDRFKERVENAHQHINALLKEEFDFSKDEHFTPSRNKLAFAADEEESREIWRKRLKYDMLQGRLNKDTDEDTRARLQKRYDRLVDRLSELDRQELMESYLTALASSYDPHSDYMSPDTLENFRIHNVAAELFGIGALLREEDGYCKIVSTTPGGPAEASNELHPGDRIVAVAQGDDGDFVDVVEEKLRHVVNLIRGPLGSTVRLEVIPAKADSSTRKIVTIVRDRIPIESQKPRARLYQNELGDGREQKLGVITLPQFHENTAADVAVLIERLKTEGVDGMILDLRRNGGGILEQAIELTGLFIDKGPVVQVRRDRLRRNVLGDREPGVVYDGPLIVLVSRLSASASEIVAAALQDYGRAVIIGDQRTHGKGTVQTLMGLDPLLPPSEVPDPGALKFTVQKFYRINGSTTQKIGVVPDYSLPSTYDYLEIGEEFLPRSLEADSIPAVDYEEVNRVEPHMSTLTERSKLRVDADEEFTFLLEDVERLKKQLEDRRISLNEAERRAEMDDQEARDERREEARKLHPVDEDQIFEIGVKEALAKERMKTLAEIKAEELAKREADAAGLNDEELEALEDEGTDVDAHLNETLRVLSDYIRLENGENFPVKNVARN